MCACLGQGFEGIGGVWGLSLTGMVAVELSWIFRAGGNYKTLGERIQEENPVIKGVGKPLSTCSTFWQLIYCHIQYRPMRSLNIFCEYD